MVSGVYNSEIRDPDYWLRDPLNSEREMMERILFKGFLGGEISDDDKRNYYASKFMYNFYKRTLSDSVEGYERIRKKGMKAAEAYGSI